MSDLNYFQQFGLGGGNNAASDNNRCVIYTRLSTTDQEDNTSLGNQAETCRKFAERNGYQIVEEFGGKGESAKAGSARKEYERMMKFVRKKSNRIRYVIFYSYDRFSREGGKAIVAKDELRAMGIIIKSASLPIDTANPMGSAMEDFQLIMSKVDNDMRRSKCVDGMIAKMKQGYWCGQAPTGYKWDKNKGEIVFHETKGPLIKKAFMWKYNDPNTTSEEIRVKLRKMGLSLSKPTMTRIFQNPFYCGMIAHNLLNGEVVEGKHPKLVSKKIFLAVNKVVNEKNARGWQKNEANDNLPLKKFMRCDCCGTPLTGFLNKQKGIHYYKCRNSKCRVNKNAKKLETLFMEELNRIKVNPAAIPFIAQQLRAIIADQNAAKFKEAAAMETRVKEIDNKLKRLRQRLVLEETITREEYNEFAQVLIEEKEQILKELENSPEKSSNLLNKVEDCLQIAAKLPVLWEKGDYRSKQRLQKVAFPDGMAYSKEKDSVLTFRVNELFRLSGQISAILTQNGSPQNGQNTGQLTWVKPNRTQIPIPTSFIKPTPPPDTNCKNSQPTQVKSIKKPEADSSASGSTLINPTP